MLITRAAHQSEEFEKWVKRANGQPVLFPMIQLLECEDQTDIQYQLANLDKIDWLVFTSENAVQFFFKYAHQAGLKFYFYPNLKIATVGEKTKLALEQLGYRTNFVPIKYTAEILAANMDENIEGKNILIPRSSKAKDNYLEAFRKRGANPIPLTVYVNQIMTYTDEEVLNVLEHEADYITFTSGSTVKGFVKAIQQVNRPTPNAKYYSIGPSTTKVAEDLGLAIDATAKVHTIEGIFELIKENENV